MATYNAVVHTTLLFIDRYGAEDFSADPAFDGGNYSQVSLNEGESVPDGSRTRDFKVVAGVITAMSGPEIAAATSGVPVVVSQAPKVYLRTVDPTGTDDVDSPESFQPGNMWINTSNGIVFIMVDNTATTADWYETTLANIGEGTIAELNAALSDADVDDDGASRPSTPFPGAVGGCQLEWQSVAIVRITPGSAVDSTDAQIISNTANRDVNVIASGENGLDTGSFASFTEYFVFLIEGSSGVAGLASLSQTSPTLPTGYVDRFRRVGTIMADGSTEIMDFIQTGKGSYRHYTWRESRTGVLRVLSGGSASVWTTVDASDAVPSTADRMDLMCQESSSRECKLRSFGYALDDGLVVVDNGDKEWCTIPAVSRQFEYDHIAGTGSLTVDVTGFSESL